MRTCSLLWNDLMLAHQSRCAIAIHPFHLLLDFSAFAKADECQYYYFRLNLN